MRRCQRLPVDCDAPRWRPAGSGRHEHQDAYRTERL